MNETPLTLLSLREPRDRTDLSAVRQLVEAAVSDGHSHWSRLSDQWDVLRCEHDGRDGTGKTGRDSKDRLRGPWEGSSDVDVALAAEILGEKVTMLRYAVAGGALSAVPTDADDSGTAAMAQMELMWYLNHPMSANVRACLAQAARWCQAFGCFIVGLGWKQRRSGRERVLVLVDLYRWAVEQGTADLIQGIMGAVEAGAQLTPEEEAALDTELTEQAAEVVMELRELVGQKSGLDELAAIVQAYAPDMCEGEPRRVARALQRGATEVDYCGFEVVENCPEWRPLRPGVDVLFPAGTESIAETEWIVEPLWLTARQVRARAAAEGWDPDWTEELLKNSGPSFGLWTEWGGQFPWLLTSTTVGQTLNFATGAADWFCPLRFTYRAVSKAGVEAIYTCVVHDRVEGFAMHEMVETIDGLMPYQDFRRDATERVLLESTGLVGDAETYQHQAKANTDAWYDAVSLMVNPPLVKPHSLASVSVRNLMRPGGEIEARRGEEGIARSLTMQPMGSVGLGIEKDKHLRMLVAKRFGLRHPEVAPELVQAGWQVETDDFMSCISQLCRRTYALIQEYGPESVTLRVTGQPKIFAGTGTGGMQGRAQETIMRDEIRGSYDFAIEFDTRNLVMEWVETMGKLYSVVLSMDTEASVPRGPIVQSLLASINPRLAGVVRSQTEADEGQARRTIADLAAIVTGQEPLFTTGQNHALALQIIRGTMEKSPLMKTYAQNPQVAAVLENYAKMHEMQVKQEQNKMIGRTGGRPVLSGGINGNGA